VRRFRTAAKGLDVRFGKPDDETGTRSIYGRIKTSDAELLERRVEALAGSVCPDDPRTHGERRTEAYGIIAVKGEVLPCRCGKPDCPATGKDPRADHIVIHIITNDPGDQDGPGDSDGPDDNAPNDGPDNGFDDGPDDGAGSDSAGPDGAGSQGDSPDDGVGQPSDRPADGPQDVAATTESAGRGQPAAPPHTPEPCPGTAVLTGGEVIPAPLLAELRAIGATIQQVPNPIDLTAVTGYRPTTALQRFVRTRDLTCCFPGCNRPAEYCDVDHTIPYGARGLTHPGNVKCLCRKHHLLKVRREACAFRMGVRDPDPRAVTAA
jgi:hypothetical protein